MSSFDEWSKAYKRPHPDITVHQMLEAAYNAGIERAAELIEHDYDVGKCISSVIRKEINK